MRVRFSLFLWVIVASHFAFGFPASTNRPPARAAVLRRAGKHHHKSAFNDKRQRSFPLLNMVGGSTNEDEENSNWLIGLCLPLWLGYVSNQWSRSSIYYLVDFSDKGTAFKAMNIDLDFSQAQYGLLASVAFTSLFAVASLVAGVASDRYNRKTLTVTSTAIWGLATLGTSASTSYNQVVVWRVLMGLSCAFSTPTAYTLLAERVPPSKAASASSLYSTGVALGGALAALSILLDTRIGWRNTALVIALFAFGSAVINYFALDDDPKSSPDSKAKVADAKASSRDSSSSVMEEVLNVLSTRRVQLLFLAAFFRFCSGLLIGVWSAPFFRLLFPENAGDYAVAQAFITGTCGIVSGLIGGFAADRISGDEDDIGRKLWVPVIGNLLAIPTWFLAINSGSSFHLAMIWLALEYLVAECWFGPTVNVLQSTVGPKIGGTAQGMFTVTGAIANFAPAILGFFYEQQQDLPSGGLSTLLGFSVCTCYLLSAVCFGASAIAKPKPKSD